MRADIAGMVATAQVSKDFVTVPVIAGASAVRLSDIDDGGSYCGVEWIAWVEWLFRRRVVAAVRA